MFNDCWNHHTISLHWFFAGHPQTFSASPRCMDEKLYAQKGTGCAVYTKRDINQLLAGPGKTERELVLQQGGRYSPFSCRFVPPWNLNCYPTPCPNSTTLSYYPLPTETFSFEGWKAVSTCESTLLYKFIFNLVSVFLRPCFVCLCFQIMNTIRRSSFTLDVHVCVS